MAGVMCSNRPSVFLALTVLVICGCVAPELPVHECIPGCVGEDCGTCPEGQVCYAYRCCAPDCDGRECGSDGCGWICGECEEGWECNSSGQCRLADCEPDCLAKDCGDDGCGGSCGGCPEHAPYCVGYSCSKHCQTDCKGKGCGDDGCGGSCGNCGCGEICNQTGVCAFVACTGKECGDDGCGGFCGDCPEESPICEAGTCIAHCTTDCIAKECGGDGCGGSCGFCIGQDNCVDGQCVCPSDCAGKECGDDGCGDSCGTCAEQEYCIDGQCVCQPACADKNCGDDGCGGSCGTCTGIQESCVVGQCECQPVCVGKECGPDGCGGSCGTCAEQEYCIDGQCVCQPDCADKNCGDDGCGGSCGVCDPLLEECVEAATGGWVCTPKMVAIPAGSFWMGCNNCAGSAVNDMDCGSDEHPYHEVYLDAYEIDRTEVTADQWSACLSAGGCTAAETGGLCTLQQAGLGDHPINCVTGGQANIYCLWAGKALCTEAQWEKGARGGCEENGGALNCKAQSRTCPWGDELPTCNLAVMGGCDGDTQSVCSRSPAGDSPYGLCDMLGNVREWVADWYQTDYYCDGENASSNGYCTECGTWPGSPEAWSNPPGPGSGSGRVLRGGSFSNYHISLRVSKRTVAYSSGDGSNLGFRCCRPK